MFWLCAAASGLDVGEEVIAESAEAEDAEADQRPRDAPCADLKTAVIAARNPPTPHVKLRRTVSKPQTKSDTVLPGAAHPGYVQEATVEDSTRIERRSSRRKTEPTAFELKNNSQEARAEPLLHSVAPASFQLSGAATMEDSIRIERRSSRRKTEPTASVLKNNFREVEAGSCLSLTFRRLDKREVTVHFTRRPIYVRFSKDWPFKVEAVGREYDGSTKLEEKWTLTHIDDKPIERTHTKAAMQVAQALRRLPWRPGVAHHDD